MGCVREKSVTRNINDEFMFSLGAGIDGELIAACRADDLETLKRLSEADIDLNNALGGSGQSALHIAAQRGSVDCVSFLLNCSTFFESVETICCILLTLETYLLRFSTV